MPLKIQNWKLALLALALMAFFISMGMWQLSRAQEKKALINTYMQRARFTPLAAAAINQPGDKRFYRATLRGEFDNAHTFLLDNKIHEGKIGYEIYTPFKAQGLNTPILIDRGFVDMGKSRRELPNIPTITGTTTLTGMLNLPPTYVSFGKLTDTQTWPLRVEYIQLTELSSLLGQTLSPYVVNITTTDIVTMKPEKHMGYAIQWFAFAFTLLILFVALNRPRIYFD